MTSFSPRLWAALIVLAATVALDIGSVAVVNPALPAIGHSLGMDDALLQWTTTGYGITFAGCLLFGGRLADVYSRRLVLAFGVGVFTAGALAASVASTAWVLIAARAVQGVGAAVSVPSAIALLSQTFPEGPARNRALGVYTTVGAASFGAGLVLGGALTSAFGWNSVFGTSAVMGVLVLVAVRFTLPGAAVAGRARALDVPGAVLVTSAMLVVGFAVTQVGTGAAAAWVAFAVLAAGFVAWERRAPEPLFPVGILRPGAVRAATLSGGLFFFALNGFLFFAPLYMQGILGFSALWSGLAVLPMSVLVAVGSTVAGRVMNRFGQRRVLVVGLVLMAVGIVSWVRTPLAGSYWTYLLPGIVVMSVGQGLAYTALTAASLTGVARDQHGVAGAFNITAQQVGAGVGVAALVAIAGGGPGDGPAARLDGYHTAYLTIACLLVLGAAAVVRLHRS